MTADQPGGPTADDEDVRSLLVEARTRARAQVLDELVTTLVQSYRAELSGHLPAPRTPQVAAADPDRAVTARDAPSSTGGQQRAWYAYCVLRQADAVGRVRPEELTGVEACPVRLVDCGALVAVAGEVPLGGFQSIGEEPDLAEDGWLATSARGHERVIERVFCHATVLPFRFGVLYPDQDRLVDAVRDGEPAMLAELSRLDGFAEWGVRAYVDDAGTDLPDPGRAPAGPDTPGAGTEWLARRRTAARASAAARDLARRVATDLHDALSRHARESVVRPRPLRATATTPVLDAAYLLARDGAATLRAAATELSDRHAANRLRFELTGPWPPYHFTRLTERVVRG